MCSKKQDYEMFYETEIELRRQLKYPPFCDIILIGLTSTNLKEIQEESVKIYNSLKKKLNPDEFNVLKPMPAPIDKIQNRFRWRIIIKGNMTSKANEILNETLKEFYKQNKKQTKVVIDVNPNNMS